MTRKSAPLAVALVLAGFAGSAPAQDTHRHGEPGASSMPGPATTQDAPSTKALKEVHMKMMGAMNIAYSGDADVDFVKGMIPHHQSAIDMARVELQFGKDEATRELAATIIKAQEKEIAEMQAWLKAKGK